MSSQSDVKAQNALDAFTAGLQAGDDIDSVISQTELSSAGVEDMVDIVQSLHSALTTVEPSRDFSDALRADLLGGRHGMIKRVRHMPARVPIAAALALVAGCLLFIMRRLIGSDAPQDIQEEAVATPL